MEELYAWGLNLASLGHTDVLLPLLLTMSAAEAWQLTVPQWIERGLEPRLAERLVGGRADLQAQVELARRYQVRFIGWRHADFPARLLDIAHPPLALAVRGELPDFEATRVLAIVGSRRATAYGREAATWFARDLARAGWLVVSGMAAGIDAAAHLGALGAGSKTVAVLGCGVERCYPSGLLELRDRIISNGCVLSEYALGSRPYPFHFPFRNRLISGLSEAVLVVEGGMSSGSLHTVDWALSQGREVLAVPGSVFAEGSQLPHFLVKSGATPAFSPADLNVHLGGPVAQAVVPSSQPLTPEETKVLSCLELPQTPSDVCDKVGLPVGIVLARLLSLEIKGQVERRPGNRYARL